MGAQGKDRRASEDYRIHFRSDGLALSPAEYALLLARLAENDGIAADEFSRDGVVTRLEERIAAMLGKETAVFLPSGTLANHLALRLLAQRGRRVLVQRESHIYNDFGRLCARVERIDLDPARSRTRDFRVVPRLRPRSRGPRRAVSRRRSG